MSIIIGIRGSVVIIVVVWMVLILLVVSSFRVIKVRVNV